MTSLELTSTVSSILLSFTSANTAGLLSSSLLEKFIKDLTKNPEKADKIKTNNSKITTTHFFTLITYPFVVLFTKIWFLYSFWILLLVCYNLTLSICRTAKL